MALDKCPFCGSDPVIEEDIGIAGTYFGAAYLKCTSCWLRASSVNTDRYSGVHSIHEEAIKELIKMWNTRS